MTAGLATARTRRPEYDLALALFLEAVNEGDFAVVDALFTEDVRDLSAPKMFRDGRAGVRAAITDLRRAFPDLHAKVTAIETLHGRAGATAVAVAVTFTGTRAPLNLQPHPLDGCPVRWQQNHVLVFEKGLVHRHHGWVR